MTDTPSNDENEEKYRRILHDKSNLGFEEDKELKEKPIFCCLNHRKFRRRSYDCRERPKGSSKPLRTNPKGPR
ncbi:hypothetical protein CR513_26246, partial [Mucuna pruriens]